MTRAGRAGPTLRRALRMAVRMGLPIAVSVVVLGLVLRRISTGDLGRALGHVSLPWTVPAIAVYHLSLVARAVRWGSLLQAAGRPTSLVGRTLAVYVGFGANAVLPGQAGEVIRPLELARREALPRSVAGGSTIAERILDGVGVPVLMAVAVLAGATAGGAGPVTVPVLALALGSVSVAVAVIGGRERLPRMRPLARWIPPGVRRRAADASAQFLDSAAVLRQGRVLAPVAAQTLAIWVMNAAFYALVLRAVGVTGPGLLGALFVQGVVACAIALPSTPGAVGPFEAAVVVALAEWRVPVADALAVAVVLRAVTTLTVSPVAAAVLLLRSRGGRTPA